MSGAWLLARAAAALAAGTLAVAAWAADPVADCPPPQPAAQVDRDPQAGDLQTRDLGMLWRLEKDGQQGWLYGTLHLGRAAWSRPGPRLSQALGDSDLLALELDTGDPETAHAIARAIAAHRATPGAQALPGGLLARLRALARAACVDGPWLAGQPPVLQAVKLTLLSARALGLDPAFAQEALLAERARAAGQRVVSLETVDSQLAALLPADPAEAEALVRSTLGQLESGRMPRQLQRLAGLWADGDLDELGRYEQWCGCVADARDRARLRRLNDDRNPALADGIAGLLASGQRVFAAVGALHMTGGQALPRLLAQRGYRVQRVRFAPMM